MIPGWLPKKQGQKQELTVQLGKHRKYPECYTPVTNTGYKHRELLPTVSPKRVILDSK